MSTEHCSRLDDYLNGELREAERVAFETHLGDCEACRRAVEVDRHWEGLLAAVKPSAPAAMVERVASATELQRGRRRGFLQAAALLFVAASLLLFLVPWFRHQNATPIAKPKVEVAPERVVEKPEVRIEFSPESRVIAMPLKSKNPQVSIVWLYPELNVPVKTEAN